MVCIFVLSIQNTVIFQVLWLLTHRYFYLFPRPGTISRLINKAIMYTLHVLHLTIVLVFTVYDFIRQLSLNQSACGRTIKSILYIKPFCFSDAKGIQTCKKYDTIRQLFNKVNFLDKVSECRHLLLLHFPTRGCTTQAEVIRKTN